jgi:hypothetical protein
MPTKRKFASRLGRSGRTHIFATATDSAQDGPPAEAEISGSLSSFLNNGPIDE